jgi:hypothetical protein
MASAQNYGPDFLAHAGDGGAIHEDFFHAAKVSDLPEDPILVLNATSLQSMRAWRFTKYGPTVGDLVTRTRQGLFVSLRSEVGKVGKEAYDPYCSRVDV